jgi:hypothetical protein
MTPTSELRITNPEFIFAIRNSWPIRAISETPYFWNPNDFARILLCTKHVGYGTVLDTERPIGSNT